MKISLFDSKSKEKLALEKDSINIYLCGPTVYDDAHLGHARSAVCFDLLFRFLRALHKEVKFARNYTDIDDKILKKMKENSQNLEELTNFYIASYERDMRALNILDPTFKPRATHYITQMIDFIAELEKKGFTYTLKDGIYFDTSKDKAYFSLSHRDLQNNVSRLENEVAKKNESDFVLWKFDENFYKASFGTGRPGWHTECVVMIQSLFKEGLDIHCGGVDLLFPHHENEAAQCRCAENKDLARIWLHNGFVKINDEKMSKSLGNSFFVKDALKEFQGEVLRLYLVSSHYRSHFSYNKEDLKAAKKRLDKFYRLKKRLDLGALSDFKTLQNWQFQSEICKEILKALSDDLNISKALAFLDEFIINANARLDEAPKDKALKESLKQTLQELALIFGFGFDETNLYFQWGVSENERLEIEAKIKLRTEAKQNKDYQKADEIRAELAKKGVVLSDTATGVIWEKNND